MVDGRLEPPCDDPKPGRTSSYVGYLPALYREDPENGDFLGRFLLAFEHVLTGVEDADDPGLEEILEGTYDPEASKTLAGIHRYFDTGRRPEDVLLPEEQRAPADFLEWLASWVAIGLRGDLDESGQRELIARAIPLYRWRGTKQGLIELLEIFALSVDITEPTGNFQLEVSSRVEVDTVLDGATPHYFDVTARIPAADLDEIARQRQLLREIIDAEKPAHTHYGLDVTTDIKFQIEKYSTIGVDTLIG